MAWNFQSKNTTAPTYISKQDQAISDELLNIENSFNLLIGDGFSMLIQKASAGGSWNFQSKS